MAHHERTTRKAADGLTYVSVAIAVILAIAAAALLLYSGQAMPYPLHGSPVLYRAAPDLFRCAFFPLCFGHGIDPLLWWLDYTPITSTISSAPTTARTSLSTVVSTQPVTATIGQSSAATTSLATTTPYTTIVTSSASTPASTLASSTSTATSTATSQPTTLSTLISSTSSASTTLSTSSTASTTSSTTRPTTSSTTSTTTKPTTSSTSAPTSSTSVSTSILSTSTASTTISTTTAAPSGHQVGVLVSLYWYPSGGSFGSTLIQAHQAYPSVPIVAILNPDSDVGTSYSPVFANATAQLQNDGITVIGYVWTDYGATPLAQAESNISLYKSWYGVNGIFFDGMANSNSAADEQYYSTLSAYAQSQGLPLTFGNPGASTLPGYVGTVNTINIYENSGMPPVSDLTQITGYGSSNFSYVAYNVQSLDTGAVNSTLPYVGYLYITNGTLPNPYLGVPPYFKALLADLAAKG